jgi:hypothetical protein
MCVACCCIPYSVPVSRSNCCTQEFYMWTTIDERVCFSQMLLPEELVVRNTGSCLCERPTIPPYHAFQWLSYRVHHRVTRTAVSMIITRTKLEAVIITWSYPHLHFSGCPRGGRGDRWDKHTYPSIHGKCDWEQTEREDKDSDPYSFCFLYFAAVTFPPPLAEHVFMALVAQKKNFSA